MQNMLAFRILLVSFTGLMLVSGCNKADKSDMASREIDLSIINYTKYNIADVRFKLAKSKATFDDWPVAGSIYFRNTSYEKLDNGQKYSYVRRNCCATLGGAQAGDKIRVLWNLVYDLAIFEGDGSSSYDQYAAPYPRPGSRWCVAIVKLPALSREDNNLTFHILPDGQLKLTSGVSENLIPLASGEVKLHEEKAVAEKYCETEVDNPWYGLTPRKHME